MSKKVIAEDIVIEPEKKIAKKERKIVVEEIRVKCPACQREVIFHDTIQYLNGVKRKTERTLISPKNHNLYTCIEEAKTKEVNYVGRVDCCYSCIHYNTYTKCGYDESYCELNTRNLTEEEFNFNKEYEKDHRTQVGFYSNAYAICKHYKRERD